MDENTSISANKPIRRSERRQVSVLFADMVGYTAIVERLGEDRALGFTRMIYDRLTEAVLEHGGAVRGFAGDSLMAVFGIPEAQEDCALRACRAALAIQSAFDAAAGSIEAQFGVRPIMRAGVSSGVAVMASLEGEDSPLTAVGNTVNLASRIQALAPAGGCLICEATRRLVEWLVEVSFDGEREIKGVARPQKLWRLLSTIDGATRFDASLARGLGPHLGRDEEMAALTHGLHRAEAELSIMDLVAEPGLGKTRLVFEFLRQAEAEDALVLSGQCSADGQPVPFLPFLEVLRGSFRLHDEDEPTELVRKLELGLHGADLHTTENLALLLNLLGLRPPDGALEGMDGVLIGLRTRDLLPALLRAQCRARRVVLLIEDIHWIDSASEELLRRLIETGAQKNLLVIQTRRPEFVPVWLASPGVTSLALKPLAATDITHLAQTRLGVDALPAALIRQITERAGGNPLFGEEILSFLIQQGALRIAAGQVDFDAGLGESGLPASMQTLLTARMDRLAEEDRALLQAAAAIGRRFDPGLLSLVVTRADETGAALLRLQAQDILHRDGESSDYVFKHVLLRDSVYQSLLSGRRAELHLSIGSALERRNADRLTETAETLAYHYALTDRSDLAFTYSALAGAKSLGVYSLGEANRYFASALALYDDNPACAGDAEFAAFLANYALCCNISLRIKPMLELAARVRPILNRFGDSRAHVLFLHHFVACLICDARYLDALGVQAELSAMAVRLGDPASLAYALVSELALSCYSAPFSTAVFEAKLDQAEAQLARIDDAYLKNYLWAYLGYDKVCRGRVTEAKEAADHMIAVGVATNDARALGYGTAMKSLIALCTDDYQTALEMSEQALRVARAEFESGIANAARYASLVPLNKPRAADEVAQYVAKCAENNWTMMGSGPETMLGVAFVMQGRIAEGIAHLEAVIARREGEGAQTSANWARLYLCEVYLAILSGQGGTSIGVLLRNAKALSKVILFGHKTIISLVETVRADPQFDPEGHYIARSALILGMLCKVKKKKPQAISHLTEALRIVKPSGPSPMQTRIEMALADLQGTSV